VTWGGSLEGRVDGGQLVQKRTLWYTQAHGWQGFAVAVRSMKSRIGGRSSSSGLLCGDRSPPKHAHFSDFEEIEMAKSNLAKLFNDLVSEKDLL